jgi:hypothetical protein
MEANDTERYAQFGMASLIPGIQHSITVLQEMLDSFRLRLVAAEGRSVSVREAKRVSRGWSEDPEERKAQMRARIEARTKKTKKPNHPRNVDHPKHDAWVKKILRSKAAAKRARAQEQRAA